MCLLHLSTNFRAPCKCKFPLICIIIIIKHPSRNEYACLFACLPYCLPADAKFETFCMPDPHPAPPTFHPVHPHALTHPSGARSSSDTNRLPHDNDADVAETFFCLGGDHEIGWSFRSETNLINCHPLVQLLWRNSHISPGFV